MTRLCLVLFATVISCCYLAYALPVNAEPSQDLIEDFVVGRVLAVTVPTINQALLHGAGLSSKQQIVKVEILEGPYKGMVAHVINDITDNPAYNINVKPGSEVILSVSYFKNEHDMTGTQKKAPEVNISDYHRAPIIYALLLGFLLLFLVLGGKTGLKALAGLLITVLLIAYVLLPLSIAGVYPLITAVFICLNCHYCQFAINCGLNTQSPCRYYWHRMWCINFGHCCLSGNKICATYWTYQVKRRKYCEVRCLHSVKSQFFSVGFCCRHANWCFRSNYGCGNFNCFFCL